ncbi:siroheme synthase CysG [Advenella mimigardefordensis]|uniref:Siroheme synthase n=1 Tax=Advenella mimigardefordensis (strain DSM 17166 / LMG 22922 / DPN7) TaxID=1247726 RepID=W0PHV4_ADVMD|nr:siroheme synthase CysG [Advenella mimigardefordensis]AHG65035.1 siroheme synthase [Advenella mimigardefordensis DPN7]
MQTFPLFADLAERPVLVIGGGTVAERKAHALLEAGARVHLAAPELTPQLKLWTEQGKVLLRGQQFDSRWLDEVFLVVAATDDAAVNQTVSDAAEAARKLVNVVDNPQLCSYIVPSVIDRSPVQIAISSNGTAPVLIRQLRQQLETLIPQQFGNMARIAGRWRGKVKQQLDSLTERRRFWETLFSSRFASAAQSGDTAGAEALLQAQLAGGVPQHGEVTLVGAGPGDPGLLTLNALQAIQQADIVFHDALISDEIMTLIRRDAERVPVGKRGGHHSVPQEQINELLISHAKKGQRVVRLKGGDPFIFGRGGEEMQAITAHGIPCRVIPGITAALGASAYAGIPLTHRDHSQSVLFVTGHTCRDENAIDWDTLARPRQTIVVYMGTVNAARITRELTQRGRDAATPVAVVSHATRPTQKVHAGTLADLDALANQAAAPALFIIGEVATVQHESLLSNVENMDSGMNTAIANTI